MEQLAASCSSLSSCFLTARPKSQLQTALCSLTPRNKSHRSISRETPRRLDFSRVGLQSPAASLGKHGHQSGALGRLAAHKAACGAGRSRPRGEGRDRRAAVARRRRAAAVHSARRRTARTPPGGPGWIRQHLVTLCGLVPGSGGDRGGLVELMRLHNSRPSNSGR